jgi:hypothetical protein
MTRAGGIAEVARLAVVAMRSDIYACCRSMSHTVVASRAQWITPTMPNGNPIRLRGLGRSHVLIRSRLR